MMQKQNIIVFGKTGSGKSSVCNLICGKVGQFKEISNLHSETRLCQKFENHLFGNPKNKQYQVIDTPGYLNSTSQNTETSKAFFDILSTIQADGLLIGLFCMSAGDIRCDFGIIEVLILIKNLFNAEVLDRIYLVVTQVNKIEEKCIKETIQKIREQMHIILNQNNLHLNYEQLFVYNHDYQTLNHNHGLEKLPDYLEKHQPYIPQLLNDFKTYNVPNNALQTIQNLREHSLPFSTTLLSQQEVEELQQLQEQQKLNLQLVSSLYRKNDPDIITRIIEDYKRLQTIEQEQVKQKYQQNLQYLQTQHHQGGPVQLKSVVGKSGCFLFGTKFQRENQGNVELVSIENIQVGDRILSINKFGDCFYDEVMIIDENKLAKELEIPMTTITYMDKFTNELISLTVTHHHFIHTYQDNKIVSKLSRDLKIGDIIKIVSQDQTMIYQTEIINLEYGFAMNGVKNIVTRESYSVIANSIHCSVHCEGDGGDLLFNVGYYMHLVFGQKAIQLLYKANKAYKSFRRGITMEQK